MIIFQFKFKQFDLKLNTETKNRGDIMNMLIGSVWKGISLGFLGKLGIIGIIGIVIVILIILAIIAFVFFKYMNKPKK